ncbi:hypothetical protein V2J09_021142 [Rumex salicifolius]
MALLLFNHSPPLSFSHFTPRASRPSVCLRSARILSSSSAFSSANDILSRQDVGDGGGVVEKTGAALLWFKHDLRVDDHPGLVAAASDHDIVLPLYVFDRRILSRFSDEMIEVLLLALEDLRKSLQAQGSNLIIRFGDAEYVIKELVKEAKVTKIIAEEEVEYNVRLMIERIKGVLSSGGFLNWDVKITSWWTPYYDLESLGSLPSSYENLKKLDFSKIKPLDPPRLPSFNRKLDWGNVPTIDDVRTFISNCMKKETWTLIKETSADIALRNEHMKMFRSYEDDSRNSNRSISEDSFQNYSRNGRKRLKKSVFATSNRHIVAGGTDVVRNALAAYLRYLEGTSRDDWQEVHQRLRETETKAGASFHALFGPALQLGIISRRRVYFEAIKYEKERNGGFLSSFGYSTVTVAATIDNMCSMEVWYWLRALKSQLFQHFPHPQKLWRWNSYLIQYTVVGSEGPSVLLVHGFGAFLEHYRDNIQSIADDRNKVYALTLLGFGESEKPNIIYTELMWAELLRDFIIEVVGEPLHLVGNSMGGYLAALVGGLWPSLTKSVILINTAGDVIPGYSSLLFSKERQISGLASFGSRLLLQYLRFSLRSIIMKCYPTRSERVDDWLIDRMLRASRDPGVIAVLESVFSVNLSIPLNHLLANLKDKVLIIQGMKDPIADSKSKLAMLKEHCSGIEVIELNAGHCPHDERPEEVNSFITTWVLKVEGRVYVESSA